MLVRAEAASQRSGLLLPSASCYTVPRMARQRLGQHFLADAGWRDRIAQSIGASRFATSFSPGPPSQTPWIEIGAGHGEMTEHLLSTGLAVTAVELDARLAAGLRKMAEEHAQLTVVEGDILEVDLEKLLGGRRARIYGNLPYYITSPILHRLFEHAASIEAIHIVIQKEVAERLAARPGTSDYGYLSVLTQYYSRAEMALEIPREAFRPPPEVTSALVSMRLPGAGAELRVGDEGRFFEFVKVCFAQKRKTLANNLRGLAGREMLRNIFAGMKLREDARAEQLSVGELAEVYRRVGAQ